MRGGYTTPQRRGKIYKKFLSTINWLSDKGGFIAAIFVIVMAFLVAAEAILRYGFNSPTVWSVEITSYLMCFAIFLALARALKEEQHVRALFIISRFSRRVQDVARIITGFVSMIGVGLLVWTGWLQAENAYHIHEVSLTPLDTPMFIIKLAIPIGGLLFLLQWIVRLTAYMEVLREK